jgi:2'-5' RNA ligase
MIISNADRTFLALTLPQTVREKLAAVRTALQSKHVRAVWQSNEKYHVTIRFLGTIQRELLEDIKRRSRALAARMSPMDLVIASLGAFPDPQKPRVIWAGVHQTDRLMNLMMDLEEECRAAGLEPERRRPHPHCTLARVKYGQKNPNLTALLKSITFDPILTRASELTLMKSDLHQGGAVYSTLTSYPFIRTRSSHD